MHNAEDLHYFYRLLAAETTSEDRGSLSEDREEIERLRTRLKEEQEKNVSTSRTKYLMLGHFDYQSHKLTHLPKCLSFANFEYQWLYISNAR